MAKIAPAGTGLFLSVGTSVVLLTGGSVNYVSKLNFTGNGQATLTFERDATAEAGWNLFAGLTFGGFYGDGGATSAGIPATRIGGEGAGVSVAAGSGGASVGGSFGPGTPWGGSTKLRPDKVSNEITTGNIC
jgi:hypothetical protein